MVQKIRLVFFAVIGLGAVLGFLTGIQYPIDPWSFLGGLIAAAIIGFLEMQFNNWWSACTEPYRPQMVKTPTKETPAQISGSALRARVLGGFVFASPAILIIGVSFLGIGIGIEIAIGVAISLFAVIFLTVFMLPMFVH